MLNCFDDENKRSLYPRIYTTMTIENQKCLNFFNVFFIKMKDFLKGANFQANINEAFL
jgi:hypothetical protein